MLNESYWSELSSVCLIICLIIIIIIIVFSLSPIPSESLDSLLPFNNSQWLKLYSEDPTQQRPSFHMDFANTCILGRSVETGVDLEDNQIQTFLSINEKLNL